MIGKTVSHYRIIEELGRGGMGLVYKAEDTKLKRTVALKFLPPELTHNQESKERFIREAHAASALEHDNICTIHEIDEIEDGQLFIVMACYEGQTLKEKIKDQRLKTKEAINIATQIAKGLQKAHEKGIVHRDIKPANIFITDDGSVKILDFGLAKLAGKAQLTKDSSTLGTVAYMSPEQLRGEEVDHRTDIWSLGVVLYEMLNGEPPFKGDYEQAISYAILNEEPRPLENSHTELWEIVKKLLAKNPAERQHDAISIIENLSNGKTKKLNNRSRSKNLFRKPIVYLSVGIFISLVIIIILIKVIFSPTKPIHTYNSIAVLPFTNISPDKENEYFCDGMTEDIIAQLSKIGELRVISRTSVMQYKTVKKKSLPEIADELNVSLILEGTVRRSDDRVRIVAQLIEAREDKHIWAETYDREVKDIFAIQSDVAEKIAGVLSVELSANEKSLIQKKPTEDFAAYNFYIKGREYYYRYRKKDNEQAIRMFKKALEIDPKYAMAYAGLANAFSQRYHRFGFSRSWNDSALIVSKIALEIDHNCAEAHEALGVSHAVVDRSSLAIEAYKKSIQSNPGYFKAVGNLAYRYQKIGQLEKALNWHKKMISLNPAFAGAYHQIGLVYKILCDDLNAHHALEKALELDPNHVYARWGLISLYLSQNKYDLAKGKADEILNLSTDSLNAFTYKGYIEHVQGNISDAYFYFLKALRKSKAKFFYNYHIITSVHFAVIQWKQGEKQKAKKIFFEFLNYANNEIDSGNESWEICYNLAGVHSSMGDQDKAIKWLDQAIDKGWRDYRIGEIEPLFENLRQDSRFKQRIERVKAIVDKAREQIKIAEIE